MPLPKKMTTTGQFRRLRPRAVPTVARSRHPRAHPVRRRLTVGHTLPRQHLLTVVDEGAPPSEDAADDVEVHPLLLGLVLGAGATVQVPRLPREADHEVDLCPLKGKQGGVAAEEGAAHLLIPPLAALVAVTGGRRVENQNLEGRAGTVNEKGRTSEAWSETGLRRATKARTARTIARDIPREKRIIV